MSNPQIFDVVNQTIHQHGFQGEQVDLFLCHLTDELGGKLPHDLSRIGNKIANAVAWTKGSIGDGSVSELVQRFKGPAGVGENPGGLWETAHGLFNDGLQEAAAVPRLGFANSATRLGSIWSRTATNQYVRILGGSAGFFMALGNVPRAMKATKVVDGHEVADWRARATAGAKVAVGGLLAYGAFNQSANTKLAALFEGRGRGI